jgi:hypothetical protein
MWNNKIIKTTRKERDKVEMLHSQGISHTYKTVVIKLELREIQIFVKFKQRKDFKEM